MFSYQQGLGGHPCLEPGAGSLMEAGNAFDIIAAAASAEARGQGEDGDPSSTAAAGAEPADWLAGF